MTHANADWSLNRAATIKRFSWRAIRPRSACGVPALAPTMLPSSSKINADKKIADAELRLQRELIVSAVVIMVNRNLPLLMQADNRRPVKSNFSQG